MKISQDADIEILHILQERGSSHQLSGTPDHILFLEKKIKNASLSVALCFGKTHKFQKVHHVPHMILGSRPLNSCDGR